MATTLNRERLKCTLQLIQDLGLLQLWDVTLYSTTKVNLALIAACFMLLFACLLFNPEDRGDVFIRNFF
jgi:hypothetical protein